MTEETTGHEPQEALCASPELPEHQAEPVCGKCRYGGIQTFWHSFIVLGAEYPCEEWWGEFSGTGTDLEHLCLRCQRCGYAWATRTADAGPPP